MSPPEPPAKHRLHFVAAVLSAQRSLRSGLMLAVIAILSGRESNRVAWLALAVIVPLSIGASLGAWLRHRYWIEGDELRVERGLLVRKRTFIPRERIVAIDVTEGVVQRIFGLVKVEIKTAAAGSQVELSAITRAAAESLQGALAPQNETAQPNDVPAGPEGIAVTFRELVFAATTSSKLGIMLSGVGWLYVQVDDLVDEHLIGWFGQVAGVAKASPAFVACVAAAVFLVAWLAAIVAELARFGGFRVERNGSDVVISRGVFEKHTLTIPVSRVQAIRFHEGLLRQPFGYATVTIESAGHAEEKGRSTVLHPFLHRDRWKGFLEQMAPGFSLDVDWLKPPPRALPRFVVVPMLLAIAVSAGLTWMTPLGAIAFLSCLPVFAYGFLCHRDNGVGVRGSHAVIRGRGLGRVTVALRRSTIQCAHMETSWLARRRDLASIRCVAISGSKGLSATAVDLERRACLQVLNWYRPACAE